MWKVYKFVERYDTCQYVKGGVTSIRKVCQLMERCDGHGGDVKVLGEM